MAMLYAVQSSYYFAADEPNATAFIMPKALKTKRLANFHENDLVFAINTQLTHTCTVI